MRGRRTGLLRDRRGATALEFVLVFPAFILFIFGMISMYSLISVRRAMDFGVEKALRYAAVHGGAGTSGVTSAYTAAATSIWADVGANSTVSVTPTSFAAGTSVTVSVTYNWYAPSGLKSPDNTTLFNAITLSTSGSMMVVH